MCYQITICIDVCEDFKGYTHKTIWSKSYEEFNMNFAWRRGVHLMQTLNSPIESRLHTKIRVKNPTNVKQRILGYEDYI